MTAVVDPHSVALLNTACGVLEMISLIASAPVLSALLRAGIDAGPAWEGLPWLFCAVLAAASAVITFVYRLPRGTTS